MVIYAASQEEAEAWGLHVAKLYLDRFGFEPHNIRVPHDEITRGYSVDPFPEYDPSEHAHHLVCAAGELPSKLTH